MNNLIQSDKQDQSNPSVNSEICENIGIETYWCSEFHKCHALKINDNILCVLYNSAVPTHALNAITEKSFKQLISDKQVCW